MLKNQSRLNNSINGSTLTCQFDFIKRCHFHFSDGAESRGWCIFSGRWIKPHYVKVHREGKPYFYSAFNQIVSALNLKSSK